MNQDLGRWVANPAPGLEGSLTWEGEVSWTEVHGPAEIELQLGQYRRVSHCLMPDGSRGIVETSFHNHDEFERNPPLWRHRRPNGTYVYGRVVVAPDQDVRFVEDEGLQLPAGAEEEVLYQDLKADREVVERLRNDNGFAKRLYAALCNLDWARRDRIATYSASWRYSAGLVADLRARGEEYIDFYCSGNEGKVAEDVGTQLARLGWFPDVEAERD